MPEVMDVVNKSFWQCDFFTPHEPDVVSLSCACEQWKVVLVSCTSR